MKMVFIRLNDEGTRIVYTSSSFEELSEDKLDEFFDWCGSDEADEEIFWDADVSQHDDTIIVEFFGWPESPQRCANLIASKLGVTLIPFYDWTKT